MKHSTAANLALFMVALGWSLAVYGAMTQLGDPHPSVSSATIKASQHQSRLVMFAGVLFLLASLWLSGYSFPTAKLRSLIAVAACILPTAAIIVSLL
jgi:hypothetical protein